MSETRGTAESDHAHAHSRLQPGKLLTHPFTAEDILKAYDTSGQRQARCSESSMEPETW